MVRLRSKSSRPYSGRSVLRALRQRSAGNEETGRREIDKSWIEAVKILLKYQPVNEEFISQVMQQDDSTLALLYFHLHFHLIRKSGEWIHDGSR